MEALHGMKTRAPVNMGNDLVGAGTEEVESTINKLL